MLALIGGTGFDRPGIIEDPEEIDMETPYGRPSAPLIFGRLGSRPIVFLRRHGVHHEYAPHRVPYRANIWALERAGVEGIIGVATVGGIGEALLPGDLMVPDQLIDYTWGRECTYYDSPDAGVKHIDFTMPFDQALSSLLINAARRLGKTIVADGVYACTQGPRLETAAEVARYARDGANVIGMTAYPECALARELELPYAAICPIVNSAAGLRESKRAIRFEALKDAADRAAKSAVDVVEEAVLMKEALPVRDFGSPRLRKLVADMWDTMHAEGGVGIAAPQVGVSERIICFGFEASSRYPDAPAVPQTVLINPTVELLIDGTADDWEDGWEGCLSVPGMRGVVPRARRIHYTGFGLDGETIEREAQGFHARVVQHEFDHLKGIVYPMRIKDWTHFGYSDVLFPELKDQR